MPVKMQFCCILSDWTITLYEHIFVYRGRSRNLRKGGRSLPLSPLPFLYPPFSPNPHPSP